MPAYDATRFTPPAPLAKVTLRNPANGAALPDVPMLLDSRADVTLVPEESVAHLGVSIDPGEGYELVGLDGSTSIARVAHMHMVLFGHTFRGRFLLIRQEWGILGRNVLNSLSVLLDGPRLTWREEPREGRP